MYAVFIETRGFTEWVTAYLPDDIYVAVQHQLMANPDCGDVMPGCGGLRKLRVVDPRRGKGKRGGARLIYLHVPEIKRFYMIDIYGKDEKDGLSADERKFLKALTEDLRREAAVAAKRRKTQET